MRPHDAGKLVGSTPKGGQCVPRRHKGTIASIKARTMDAPERPRGHKGDDVETARAVWSVPHDHKRCCRP